MLLLAADTSGEYGSIALAECGPKAECNALDVVPLAGGTFSAQLVPQIAALLAKHGFDKSNIGAFAVASGPGSFTGLRVGLAAVKALAEVLEKPIAAVSLLECVARSGKSQGKVLAALDAGRGEIYAGEYEVAGSAILLSERLLAPEEFLASRGQLTIVTPDAGVVGLARNAGLQVEEIARPRSDMVARLGWEKIQAGQTISPENLEANYIRRSDAEIFSKPNQ
jgi:tRNA threonylcarbamoyladenosine biosynthesis protein TsaB